MRRSYKILILLSWLLAACTGLKGVPDGDLLYTGAKVTVKGENVPKKDRKTLKAELKELPRPKPNRKFLWMRPKLFFYNLAGDVKKEKGFRHWLKYKVGEPPVLFSKVDLEYNGDVLRNHAENRGYFKTTSSADSTKSGRTARADYTLTVGRRYHIREVSFPPDSTKGIERAIGRTVRRTFLKKGDPYDLEVIKAERDRIDQRLKQRGYYYFNADYLLVEVDSTVGKYEVDLTMRVKPDAPKNALVPYRIHDIFVYPNFTLNDTVKGVVVKEKSFKDFTIIDPEHTFNPRVFDRVLLFQKNDLYNRRDHNLSLNRLVNLGTFKFVKNEFRPAKDTVGNFLDAYYYLTPLPPKSLQVKVLGKTNSANYTGTELNIDWKHRNTFRGAELLTLSLFGGLEVQVSGQNKGFNVFRIGGEASLVWPRFISPFPLNTSSGFVPQTKALVGYEYQQRTNLYSLTTFRGQFGYLWKDRIETEHQLNVTEVTFVRPTDVTPLYESQMEEVPSLRKVIEKQFIFGPTYSYTYTNTMRKRLKNTFYFHGKVDLAGNAAGLLSGADVKAGKQKEFLGVAFSQFVKVEADLRHYLKLGENSQLASRLIAGVGFAYGNSTEMPYIKQFFIGGTNSIRAFRARSIGPGSFDVRTLDTEFLPDQSGDAKLEFNTEYRAKIYSVVHGALFLDAGNIWLLHEDINRPGAKFTSKFMDDLAVGTGAGLRVDLSFLVLRLDLAFPLRVPYLPSGEKWVANKIAFGNPDWRRDNLVLNIAIGYPF